MLCCIHNVEKFKNCWIFILKHVVSHYHIVLEIIVEWVLKSRPFWTKNLANIPHIINKFKKWLEAEKIAPTDLLYSTIDIYNILVCNTNFLTIYITYQQDLWGIYGRENSVFGILITHSTTMYAHISTLHSTSVRRKEN